MTDPMARALSQHDSRSLSTQAFSKKHVAACCAIVLGLALAYLAGPAHAATLKDSTDRSVDVTSPVTAVVPAGAPAQALLHALAPDKLAGLVEGFKPEQAIYVDPKIAALPQIPMLTRTDAPGDVAMVAGLKPGLVVDYGNVSARYAAAIAKIQQEIGVPAVLYGGDLAASGEVAKALGGAIGGTRADAVAALVADVLAQAKPASDVADTDRIPVYLARGQDGLKAIRAGTSFDEPIRLAGGRNVVTGGGGTMRTLTVADVVALKPAVVIVAEEEALHGALRAALPKATRFVLDAGEPYKVLTGPPSINRLVGLAALAPILHPDKVKTEPDAIRRVETGLYPIPPGLAVPLPLQVRE